MTSADRPGGRARPNGRIGGLAFLGGPQPEVVERFRRALGPGGRLLVVEAGSPGGEVVAEWDACWDGDRAVLDVDAWKAVLDAGRLAMVEGAFAVAWTSEDGTVRLARDAVGERSLFVARRGRGVAFASALPPLLASGLVPRRLDPVGLASYLSYAYVPGARTLVEGVTELLPGELVEVRPGSVASTRFWSLPAERPTDEQTTSENERRALLRSALERAVDRRLPPPGEPVAATLSGGIDSSLVVALAGRRHDGPVHTLSLSFGRRYPNELEFSSAVARHCGTSHQVVELRPRHVLRHLDDSIGALGTPIGDPLTVPNSLLFSEASTRARVVLNGEGGDPCFGGPKNLPMVLALLYGEQDRERLYLRLHRKCFEDLAVMLRPDVAASIPPAALENELRPHLVDPRWTTLVNRLMAINVTLKGASHILAKVDQESAAYGLLPRSPLFDRSVVDLSFTLPLQDKLRGSVEKYLLKQAVADLVPAEIVVRPKSGMRVPVEAWFAGPLLRPAKSRLLDGLAPWDLFQPGYLRNLIDVKAGGYRQRRGVKIWLLLTLESWLRTVLAPGPVDPDLRPATVHAGT